MQLNELIEQEGIDKISLKTTISEINLTYLQNEEFEKLTRVKALGFLIILEREYKGLNATALRESIKLYFEDHKPDVDNVIVAARDPLPHAKGGISFFKWFVILGIGAATWYLYTQGNLDNLVQNIETKKDIYDDTKALESNISSTEAERVSVKQKEEKEVAIETPVAPKIKESIVLSSSNATKVVAESNVTEVTTATTAAVEKMTTVTAEKQTFILPSASEGSSEVVEESEATPITTITTITINPTRGMLWFGFINIDTKVRKEFMKKVSTPFDIHDGRWLLVTGHGFVDIVSDLQTVEVADRNKHYFYIDSQEIRELSQREFRNMNGRRGW
jgi:hypothetical protein